MSAAQAVADALKAADLSCEVDEDCEEISIDTKCHAACGGLVGPAGKTTVQAAIAEQNTGICATFERDGCKLIIPPCVPPQGFWCFEGTCIYDDFIRPRPDAGAPDSGSPPGCLAERIVWGLDGGFVAYRDSFTVTPCADFTAERMGVRGSTDPAACTNAIAADGTVTTDDVNAALANPDVTEAFDAATTLYGRDTRPVDGSVFRIQRGRKVIELGLDCNGSDAGCRAIPPGLAALRDLLEAIAAQQLALPGCEAFE